LIFLIDLKELAWESFASQFPLRSSSSVLVFARHASFNIYCIDYAKLIQSTI